MKKNLVLTALTLAAAAVSAAEVKDGFDSRWGMWAPKASKAAFKINKAEGNTAPGCGEITFKAGHPAGQYGCFTKKFPAAGGKTPTLGGRGFCRLSCCAPSAASAS